MAGKIALVTGASGFTGRHLVPALKSNGFHVAALGQGVSAADENVACDLTDAQHVL